MIVLETCWQIGWCSGSDCDYTEFKTISWDCLTVHCHVIMFIHNATVLKATKTLQCRIRCQPRSLQQAQAFRSQHIHSAKTLWPWPSDCNFMFCNSISAELRIMLCVVMELGWFYIHVLYSTCCYLVLEKKRLCVSHGTRTSNTVCRRLMPKTPVLGNSNSDWTCSWLRSSQHSEKLLNVTEMSWDRQSYMDIK